MAEMIIQLLDVDVSLAARHAVAVAKPTVHQELDELISLTPLIHGDVLATALAQVAVIHPVLLSHAADGGATALVDAPHRSADTSGAVTALQAAGIPTSLPTLITWIGLAKNFLVAHGNAAGVHFTNDTGSGVTGFTLTVDPPVTQNDCNDDINAIRTGYNTHADLASLL